MKYFFLPIILTAAVFYSCAPKTDLSQFPISNGNGNPNVSETTYVEQSPPWTQFNKPQAVMVGREPVIYVADTKNNQVVQLDLAGGTLGALHVRNPVALAQDYNFDLLVIGDSVMAPTTDTVNVLYRIKMVAAGGIISNGTLIPMLTSDYPTPLTSRRRRFTGVDVFSDNTYIVARTGPDNTSSYDPDNALLKIRGTTVVQSVTSLSGFQVTGGGVYSIDKISAITTFTGGSTDFILTRNSPEYGFKVLWFVFDEINGTYNPNFIPEDNVDILNKQLGTPVGVALDPNNNIFVVDNTNDSLYKFNRNGALKKESFGGTGSGTKQLNKPHGVSFFNKVLYIADTENNRIVRYKLSTDLN